MNKTRFGQLVVGEKFRLPGSDVLMIKETLRQEPGSEWVNATYDITEQGRLCYVHNDTKVVRRRSNQDTALRRGKLKSGFGEMMINGHNLGRLIELAFDYVSAETEQQANQVYDQAAKLVTEPSTFDIWLELTDHIRAANSNSGRNYPHSWAGALKFLSARQVKLNPSRTGDQ